MQISVVLVDTVSERTRRQLAVMLQMLVVG